MNKLETISPNEFLHRVFAFGVYEVFTNQIDRKTKLVFGDYEEYSEQDQEQITEIFENAKKHYHTANVYFDSLTERLDV